jgi:hypothetical protein
LPSRCEVLEARLDGSRAPICCLRCIPASRGLCKWRSEAALAGSIGSSDRRQQQQGTSVVGASRGSSLPPPCFVWRAGRFSIAIESCRHALLFLPTSAPKRCTVVLEAIRLPSLTSSSSRPLASPSLTPSLSSLVMMEILRRQRGSRGGEKRGTLALGPSGCPLWCRLAPTSPSLSSPATTEISRRQRWWLLSLSTFSYGCT